MLRSCCAAVWLLLVPTVTLAQAVDLELSTPVAGSVSDLALRVGVPISNGQTASSIRATFSSGSFDLAPLAVGDVVGAIDFSDVELDPTLPPNSPFFQRTLTLTGRVELAAIDAGEYTFETIVETFDLISAETVADPIGSSIFSVRLRNDATGAIALFEPTATGSAVLLAFDFGDDSFWRLNFGIGGLYSVSPFGGLLEVETLVDGTIAGVREVFLEGPDFQRGDVDGSGTVELADAIDLLGFLFSPAPVTVCADAADFDDDGAVGLVDAIASLNFQFAGGAPPAAPMSCGADPSLDSLDCRSTSCP